MNTGPDVFFVISFELLLMQIYLRDYFIYSENMYHPFENYSESFPATTEERRFVVLRPLAKGFSSSGRLFQMDRPTTEKARGRIIKI